MGTQSLPRESATMSAFVARTHGSGRAKDNATVLQHAVCQYSTGHGTQHSAQHTNSWACTTTHLGLCMEQHKHTPALLVLAGGQMPLPSLKSHSSCLALASSGSGEPGKDHDPQNLRGLLLSELFGSSTSSSNFGGSSDGRLAAVVAAAAVVLTTAETIKGDVCPACGTWCSRTCTAYTGHHCDGCLYYPQWTCGAVCCCRDKPRLVSDGEKMALLYNIACCHSQLQDARSGLVALAGAEPYRGHRISTGSMLQLIKTLTALKTVLHRRSVCICSAADSGCLARPVHKVCRLQGCSSHVCTVFAASLHRVCMWNCRLHGSWLHGLWSSAHRPRSGLPAGRLSF